MDQELRALLADLRKMKSSEAADWLMDHYPVGSAGWGNAVTIMAHLSWRRADQDRLASHYLSRLPYASAKPYEVFASFMKVSRLIDVLTENAPSDADRKGLLAYHVGPVLKRAAKTADDQEMVRSFMSRLTS